MDKVKIEITQDTVTDALQRLVEKGGSLQPAMEAIGRVIQTKVQQGFDSGQDPYGIPWLAPKFRSGQPLRDTGRLRNSIDYVASNDEVTIGTNVCYAIVHQFGATVKAGAPPHVSICGVTTKGAKMLAFPLPGGGYGHAKQVEIPQRKFLPTDGLPDSWADDVLRALVRHLTEP